MLIYWQNKVNPLKFSVLADYAKKINKVYFYRESISFVEYMGMIEINPIQNSFIDSVYLRED